MVAECGRVGEEGVGREVMVTVEGEGVGVR